VTAAPVLRLEIHPQPRASRNGIVGRHGHMIKVQVHAPPAGGAANAALVEVLAAALGVPRRAVTIVRGETSRDKLVEVHTRDLDACRLRLAAALETQGRVDKSGTHN